MNKPGFTAEASVYRSAQRYVMGGAPANPDRTDVGPAAVVVPIRYRPCPIGCSEVCEEIYGPGGSGEVRCRCIC